MSAIRFPTSLHLAIALALTLLLPLGLSAAVADAPVVADAKSAPMLNTVCPMDGKPIDSNSPSVPITVGEGAEAKHFRMAMCNTTCCADFMKDPAPAMQYHYRKDGPGPKSGNK